MSFVEALLHNDMHNDTVTGGCPGSIDGESFGGMLFRLFPGFVGTQRQVIIDASMPAMIRDGGKMWNKEIASCMQFGWSCAVTGSPAG